MSTIASRSITAENQFTTAVRLSGQFNVSVSGTFSATVTIQRSPDNTNWYDVDTFTAPTEQFGTDPEQMYYRIGVKTGGFGSGTVVVRLGQDGFQPTYVNA
jgi:hypothetical protein